MLSYYVVCYLIISSVISLCMLVLSRCVLCCLILSFAISLYSLPSHYIHRCLIVSFVISCYLHHLILIWLFHHPSLSYHILWHIIVSPASALSSSSFNLSFAISFCPLLAHHVLCYLVICLFDLILSFAISFHPPLSRYILCHLIKSLLSQDGACFLIISSVISLYGLLSHCTLCYLIIPFAITLNPLLSLYIICYVCVLSISLGCSLAHRILSHLIICLLSHHILRYLNVSFVLSLYHLSSPDTQCYLIICSVL